MHLGFNCTRINMKGKGKKQNKEKIKKRAQSVYGAFLFPSLLSTDF